MEPNLVTLSPFETDIAAQPDALRAFARGAPRPELAAVLQGQYDRVIFTGMGSSHFAALPSWRRLVAGDYSTWWVDTGQLLDSDRLITPATLLVVTSQSGASGEITALLAPDARTPVRPRAVVGITNEAGSPLAEHADAIIALRCGAEATVSTKSYLTSLAAHQHLLHVLTGAAGPAAPVTETAELIENLGPVADAAGALARVLTAASNPRVAYIGSKDHAATALYAGLITKEAAKMAAEGFIGGQFRHGPLELAGPGLAAVLFGAWAGDTATPLAGLAADLIASGADVTLVGDLVSPGARTIAIPRGDTLPELAAGAVVAQHVAVAIARARGIEPGAFAYGRKVTTTL
jgi:glutamine---fructose-6-phosphate transaminase (isomerizing)